jgi:hypothetical protein
MDAINFTENYIVTEKRAISLKRMLFASKKTASRYAVFGLRSDHKTGLFRVWTLLR